MDQGIQLKGGRAVGQIGRRHVGRTGLSVTELGFGAASLGNLYREVTRNESYAAVDAAWDVGMRYFDTAPYYGFGLSERRIGNIVRYRPRGEYVVSTKVGRLLRPAPDHEGSDMRHGFCSPMPFEPEYDYSYDGIMRSYEDSLQRLGLAKIDILLVHDIGVMTHGARNGQHFHELANGGFRALEELRACGDIQAVGLGVNEWQICEAAMEIARFDCFLLAGRYTLLEQGALDTFIPKCAAHGASVIIGGAYNSGILATGVGANTEPYYNYEPAPQAVVNRVAAIEAICRDHGVPLPAAALQFPLAHDCVASVVPGVGSAARVHQTKDLFRHAIPPVFWRDLKSAGLVDERVPTP